MARFRTLVAILRNIQFPSLHDDNCTLYFFPLVVPFDSKTIC